MSEVTLIQPRLNFFNMKNLKSNRKGAGPENSYWKNNGMWRKRQNIDRREELLTTRQNFKKKDKTLVIK